MKLVASPTPPSSLSVSSPAPTNWVKASAHRLRWQSIGWVAFSTWCFFATKLEPQAAEDALHRVYLTRTPDEQIQLPTSTFPPNAGGTNNTLFRVTEGDEATYTPPELVEDTEVLYYSADRSGRGR